jgi:serine/threonine protein kinase
MGKVAIKIILKKNVKGNEQMVYDELEMLQRMKHPHIVKFVDWFESRVREEIHVERSTGLLECRTNIISSLNLLPEENCSIVFASRGDSQRGMLHRLLDRSLKLSITYTTIMSCTEVNHSNPIC